MKVVQSLSMITNILPEWNLSEEMKKTQSGVPLNFSTIFLHTPMEFLLKGRGLDVRTLHQYLKFAPVFDGKYLKFAFYIGPPVVY